MKVIYVAGPFRARTPWEVEQNIRKAEALSLEVWKVGCAAICPHTLGRFFDKSLPDKVFLAGDKAIIKRCDGMILVDSPRSEGVSTEIKLAQLSGIRIFNNISELRKWLKYEQC